jgi:hypothetical protein
MSRLSNETKLGLLIVVVFLLFGAALLSPWLRETRLSLFLFPASFPSAR